MSINRMCTNCFRKENVRYNFGNDIESEKRFHSEKWCDCGYNSPEEMMLDQDMGFTDPNWLRIAKDFLTNYHAMLASDKLESKEEQTRFFLKQLKNSANNVYKSIELVEIKKDEGWQAIFDGKTEKKPKTNIF